MIVTEPLGHQALKSLRTRERVVKSTVDLIRREGLASASPVRIARHTGLSWGAVQHHFGSKEELLRVIVGIAQDEFIAAIAAQDFMESDLSARVSQLVDAAWTQYHGDIFLAAVEITFWHRNNDIVFGDTIISNDLCLDDGVARELGRAFAGMGIPTETLLEAILHMHCVLTGIAYQEILAGESMLPERHLAHCKRTVETIILAGKSEEQNERKQYAQ